MLTRSSNDMSDSDSGDAASGDEGENENPYPLEGKYVDEYDREKCVNDMLLYFRRGNDPPRFVRQVIGHA